jgi:transposase
MSKNIRRSKKTTTPAQSMPIVNADTAAVDIGATEMFACVPDDRDATPIRRFGAFTEDLLALSAWFSACHIKTVALESTGVYWIPLYQILEDAGFEVYLSNARSLKNVSGRKSDVGDSQWLQFLHSVGLVRTSFRPSQQVCAVRSILRHRCSLIEQASMQIQHIQKALVQMNLQIHHVISDLMGVTG